jgi:hypothetical protein
MNNPQLNKLDIIVDAEIINDLHYPSVKLNGIEQINEPKPFNIRSKALAFAQVKADNCEALLLKVGDNHI